MFARFPPTLAATPTDIATAYGRKCQRWPRSTAAVRSSTAPAAATTAAVGDMTATAVVTAVARARPPITIRPKAAAVSWRRTAARHQAQEMLTPRSLRHISRTLLLCRRGPLQPPPQQQRHQQQQGVRCTTARRRATAAAALVGRRRPIDRGTGVVVPNRPRHRCPAGLPAGVEAAAAAGAEAAAAAEVEAAAAAVVPREMNGRGWKPVAPRATAGRSGGGDLAFRRSHRRVEAGQGWEAVQRVWAEAASWSLIPHQEPWRWVPPSPAGTRGRNATAGRSLPSTTTTTTTPTPPTPPPPRLRTRG